jgi:hypothetical protein
MATQTTNIGLTKPAGTDNVSRQVINDNYDILDTEIGARQPIVRTSSTNIEPPTTEEINNATIGSICAVKTVSLTTLVNQSKLYGMLNVYWVQGNASQLRPYIIYIHFAGQSSSFKPYAAILTFVKVRELSDPNVTLPTYESIEILYAQTSR